MNEECKKAFNILNKRIIDLQKVSDETIKTMTILGDVISNHAKEIKEMRNKETWIQN